MCLNPSSTRMAGSNPLAGSTPKSCREAASCNAKVQRQRTALRAGTSSYAFTVKHHNFTYSCHTTAVCSNLGLVVIASLVNSAIFCSRR